LSGFFYRRERRIFWFEKVIHKPVYSQDNIAEGSIEPLIFILEDEETNELMIKVYLPVANLNTLKLKLLDERSLYLECNLSRRIESELLNIGFEGGHLSRYKTVVKLPKPVKKISRISFKNEVVIVEAPLKEE